MNILITGGSGFIGSRLSLALVARGHRVRVMDSLSPQIHGADPERSPLYLDIRGKVDFLRGDVSSKADWERAIEGQDAIVHLAAETGTGQSMYEIDRYVEINVRGTAMMLDLLVNGKHRIKKVVVASSRAIYGEGKYRCAVHGAVYPLPRKDADMGSGDFNVKCPSCGANVDCLPTDEESLIHPTSIYGMTKHEQERMTLAVCGSIGLPAVAFRYQNVYGPGQSLKNPYTGILSIFSTRLLNGNEVQIFEDGTESRDFVFIDDVVKATVLGIESPDADGHSFNVGSGERTTVSEVVDALVAGLGAVEAKSVITGKYRVGDIRHNVASIERIRKLLGYEPSVKFAAGIASFCEWVRGQDVESDSFDRSIREMSQRGLYK